jgi:hypothetical protein
VDIEEIFHIDLVTIVQFRLRLAFQLKGVGSAKFAAVCGTLVWPFREGKVPEVPTHVDPDANVDPDGY